MAPFTVNSKNVETYVRSPETYKIHNIHRKFIINLGWIPRSRKHLVADTISSEPFGEETYASRQ